MTKIRIETKPPEPIARSEVRPWLRYTAVAVIAGAVVWTMVSPEAGYQFETALRAASRLIGL